MVKKQRIYQILRKAGLINTRADAIKLLNEGKVLVNNNPIYNPEFQVNPKKEIILVNNKPFSSMPKKYFLLNKPLGYLTSKKRSLGKKHVLELIHCDKKLKNTLFPIGRLDYNTTGLLLITNDGDFAHKVLQPRNKIEKEYMVTMKGRLSDSDLKHLEMGIEIIVDNHPYKTLPAKVKIINSSTQSTSFSIIITEGKKRQVRLMVAALGHTILSLKRIRIGTLLLGEIPESNFRELTENEMKKIKQN